MKSKKIFILKHFLSYIIAITILIFFLDFLGQHWFQKNVVKGQYDNLKDTVLIIGDSQSLDYPSIVRKNFSNLNILNLSESGTGPDVYLSKLYLALRLYKPKRIFVAVYFGNDILNIVDFVENPGREKLKLWLAKRSFFYHVFRMAYFNIKHVFLIHFFNINLDYRNPFLKKKDNVDEKIIENNVLIATPKLNLAWTYLEKFILEMKNISDKNGASITFLLIPENLQISRSYEKIYFNAGYSIPLEGLLNNKMQKRFNLFAEKNGLSSIDFLPIFKRQNQQNLFFRDDPHLNSAGVNLIAAELSKNKEHGIKQLLD